MKSYKYYTILIICILLPSIGNCQKTIKRKTNSVKEQHVNSKKSNTKKTKVSNSGINKTPNQTNTPVSADNKKMLLKKMLSNMIEVKGGYFIMGSEDMEALSWEKPVHMETVNSFRIGKYEVSQKEWDSIMENNPSLYVGEDFPVQGVSMEDCLNFIKRLNELSGLNFRLPTEVEWEYAAKGGKESKGYSFSGSDDIDDVAWYVDNCGSEIHAIGSKKPNELGIYDMSGNVWEWTSDQFSKNYSSPRKGSDYVIRGGSWLQEKNDCRVTNRYYTNPTTNGLSYGFRLVLDSLNLKNSNE